VNLARASVNRRTFTWFATIIALVAGMMSYFQLGRLEDPEFTVKNAVVATPYPGATAEEVELEVTDRIEKALQEMVQLKRLESFSRAGYSQINVEILARYSSAELPQVWDELRKKVRDVTSSLPPGAGTPTVADDFGDVYGFLLAVVGDGFTPAELESYADLIKKELSLVKGVARVELWGVQPECIYIEVSQARLATLGLTMEDVQRTLEYQNLVVDGGGVDIQVERLRFETTGQYDSEEAVADLIVRGRQRGGGDDDRLIRIRDIGTVRRGLVEPSTWEMRFNGLPAISVYASALPGANAVEIGTALDRRIAELTADLPVGIETHKISWQSDLVAASIDTFTINLLEAVAIVLIVLCIFMGVRTAIVIGLCGLVFTIVISFLFMGLMDIDLQRMSLGALVIAMGMMVDNAIVVGDGIITRMQRGIERTKAAVEAATQPAMPLLGATVVAVLAFYPIYSSPESAGEYCASLFSVVAIALLVSWVLAVTITPVMCIAVLPAPKGDGGDVYGGRFYRAFRGLVEIAIRRRWIVLGGLIGFLVLTVYGFRWVPQMFFPLAARSQFMVDYWAPEGTRIEQVSAALRELERDLMDDPRVTGVSTFVGQGPPRFYLPVDPESPYASYGQLIVNTAEFRAVQELIPEIEAHAEASIPEAEVIARKYGLGPFETWPVEARFSGTALADPAVLRGLADQARAIIRESPHADIVNTNWRQRVKKIVSEYDDVNARLTGVLRSDVADATRRAHDGLQVGLYREEDKLLPILVRHVEAERRNLADSIDTLQVRPPYASESMPLSQVVKSVGVEWEDPLIWRWDRRRAITVQAVPDDLASVLLADVRADVEAIDLPPGYALEWDGEFRSSADAQASLVPGVIPAVIVMALIVVGLFNAYRPPLVIVGVIPFALIGVTVGLLVTRQPFGFVALLGAMSLAGMMIKNAIVLLDEIGALKAAGKSDHDAVVEAAVSRVRPVMLAAATTVLGVIPLLQDVFWISMAVTIMFGLALGSLLTVVVVPVLYACFYRIRPEPASTGG
jgi:multidrug efflux pump subunit AcrB